MKKNAIVCGVIAGILSSAWMLWSVASHDTNTDYEKGMLYGYASMILAFSLIFVGIKNYRDKYNNGVISFGKAFKVGLYISLIASTIYVGSWLIDYFYFVPDFMENYSEHILKKMKAEGATQAMLDIKATEMAEFTSMYKNPFFNALLGYAEILPVGLLITLIASLILKRKNRVSSEQIINS